MNIKLLQWNIWYKENFDNIISELKRIDADIVCIQELTFYTNDTTNIGKLLKTYEHVDFAIAHTFEDGRVQCNAILSKYPFCVGMHGFVQNQTNNIEDYSREGRIYIEDKIRIGEYDLWVGTTHLSYTDRFEETPLKDDEVNNLLKFLKRHKKREDKFIFSGDLNSNKDSDYVKEISKNFKSYDTENTWTTKPFSYNGFEETKLNWKLDYIFTTDDIIVKNVEVLKTDYSDHLPILATIELK